MSPDIPHWTWRSELLLADWRMYQVPFESSPDCYIDFAVAVEVVLDSEVGSLLPCSYDKLRSCRVTNDPVVTVARLRSRRRPSPS